MTSNPYPSLEPQQLANLLERVVPMTRNIDRNAALGLYLFLPITLANRHYRSSLEALLRDSRGAAGRNLDTGEVIEPAFSQSWLAAIGYLALVDQMSALLKVPPAGNRLTTGFERLLIWNGMIEENAAALYALRCSIVHSYGLLNDPRKRRATPKKAKERREANARHKLMMHVFQLGASGAEIVQLGDRGFRVDGSIEKIDATLVDLRSLGDEVEALVRRLRFAYRSRPARWCSSSCVP
jgi:hypothetical protein